MKVIRTHYWGPTERHGARIKATDSDWNRITVPYDHAAANPHDVAAVALCRRMGWSGTLVRGSMSGTTLVRGSMSGTGYVYVWLDDSALVPVVAS